MQNLDSPNPNSNIPQSGLWITKQPPKKPTVNRIPTANSAGEDSGHVGNWHFSDIDECPASAAKRKWTRTRIEFPVWTQIGHQQESVI
jgi:hypothetical protein